MRLIDLNTFSFKPVKSIHTEMGFIDFREESGVNVIPKLYVVCVDRGVSWTVNHAEQRFFLIILQLLNRHVSMQGFLEPEG